MRRSVRFGVIGHGASMGLMKALSHVPPLVHLLSKVVPHQRGKGKHPTTSIHLPSTSTPHLFIINRYSHSYAFILISIDSFHFII